MFKSFPQRVSVPYILGALAFAGALSACGDSDDPQSTSTGSTSTLAGSGSTPSASASSPSGTGSADGTQTAPQTPAQAFAVLTQVYTPDSQKTYLMVTDRIDPTVTLDVAQGVELPGRSIGVGIPEIGAVIVGGSEGPTLTKYTLTPQGTLMPAGQLSFAAQGVASIGEYQGQFYAASAQKAYFFDGTSAQILVFNPTTMTVIKAIDLQSLSRAGMRLTFSPRPVRSGNRLVMPVGWRSADNLSIPSETGVVAIDVMTDAITVDNDLRCGYARDIATDAGGKIYFLTDAYASAVHRLTPANAPKPCILRYDPVTAQYDDAYYVDATTLVSGAAIGSWVPGPNGTALVRVLSETKAVQVLNHPKLSPRLLASAPVWDWWSVTLGDTPSALALTPEKTGSGSLLPLDVGTRLLLPEFALDRSNTVVNEVLAQGIAAAPSMTVNGLSFSITQIR